jgi:hypothetical protein
MAMQQPPGERYARETETFRKKSSCSRCFCRLGSNGADHVVSGTSVLTSALPDTLDDENSMLAFLSPTDWVQLTASAVTAAATVWYAVLTRKLWAATNSNVALTQQMVQSSEEPLCAISGMSASFTTGTLAIEFEVKNGGHSPLHNVWLVTDWKGFDCDLPHNVTFREEWIGVLLPGEAVRRKYAKAVVPIGLLQHGLKNDLHVGFYVRYEGRLPGRFAHILLAYLDGRLNTFRIRKSFIVKEGEGPFDQAYKLLDDVSAVVLSAGTS